MSLLIVDASVAAKWFVEEEYGQAALEILDQSNQLHAPDFMLLEIDSIVCKWIRRDVLTAAEGSGLRDALRHYPIEYHPFNSYLDSAFAIAVQTGQSIYDCLYVALASLLEARMVTADRRLYEGLANGPFADYVVWIGEAA